MAPVIAIARIEAHLPRCSIRQSGSSGFPTDGVAFITEHLDKARNVADPYEGQCFSSGKKGDHPPEKDGIALFDDGLTPCGKLSR